MADVLNNGRLDIITANKGPTRSACCWATATAPSSRRRHPCGTRPSGLAVADLNGDGIPEIVVANWRRHDRDPAGRRRRRPSAAAVYARTWDQVRRPRPACVADLTGDGIPDIIYPDMWTRCDRAAGHRRRHLRAPADLPAELGSYSVQVVDFNGDGKPDIVDANAATTASACCWATATAPSGPSRPSPSGSTPAVAVADLTGDGIPDIVTANAATTR